MRYSVLLFIRVPFYVWLIFIAICFVFWLFWLSYQYLPSDWKPNPGEGSSPVSPGRRLRVILMVYCIASLLHCALVYCNRSCLWMCNDNSKLCASIFTNWVCDHLQLIGKRSVCVSLSAFFILLCICVVSCVLPLRDIFSYFYGAI